MKKITLLFALLISSIGFSQTGPVDFESAGIGATWTWSVDQNASNPPLEIVDNPNATAINNSAKVAKFTAKQTGNPWALVISTNIGSFTFSDSNSLVTLKVRKGVSTDVAIKFEGPGVAKEIKVKNTVVNGDWQELKFDFSSENGKTFNLLVIIPDFQARNQDNIVYFDDLTFSAQPVATCTDGIKNGSETGIDCGGSCNACPVIALPLDFSNASQLFTYNAAGQAGGSVVLEGGKMRFNGNGHAYDQAYLDLTTSFSLMDNNNNTFKVIMNPQEVPAGEERTHLIRASFAGGSAAGTQITGKSIGSGEQEVTFNFGVSGAEAWTQIIIFMDFGPNGGSDYNGKVTDYLISSIALGADPVVAQVPPTGAAPTPPGRNAADVISIYSKITDNTSVYADISDIDFPNWGGNSGQVIPVAFENDLALKIPAFTYQGVQFPITNLSGMTKLHLDIWAQTQGVGLDLIQEGGVSKRVNITSQNGQWSSVDIALSDFTDLDLTKIFQMKFYGLNGANADGSLDIYLDNIYFYTGTALSIDKNNILNVNLFPNPANNKLNISAANTIKNAEIYNVLGKKVMNVTINKTSESIDISTLASGVYMIKYNIENTVGTAKFIKQ